VGVISGARLMSGNPVPWYREGREACREPYTSREHSQRVGDVFGKTKRFRGRTGSLEMRLSRFVCEWAWQGSWGPG
jgi:hypothetical protein